MKIDDLDVEKMIEEKIIENVESYCNQGYWTDTIREETKKIANKMVSAYTEEKVESEINSIFKSEFIDQVNWGESEKHDSFEGFVYSTIQSKIRESFSSYDCKRIVQRLIEDKVTKAINTFTGDIQKTMMQAVEDNFELAKKQIK